MARIKPVVWSASARLSLIEVIKYWRNRTQSIAYPARLLEELTSETQKLGTHPELGRTVHGDALSRVLIHEHYAIYYDVREHDILITCFWDQRQDPADNPIESLE